MRGVQFTRLPQQAVPAGGGVLTYQVAGLLPAKRRILGFMLRLDGDLTQPGAAAAVQLGAVLAQLVGRVQVGQDINVSGLGLAIRHWRMTGRRTSFPAGFPATLGAVFSRALDLYCWYKDENAFDPYAKCPPSEQWVDPIQVTMQSPAAVYAATAPTIGNANLQIYVVHDAAPGGKTGWVPSMMRLLSVPQAVLAPVLNYAGAYVGVDIYREAANDAGAITSAQIASIQAMIDSMPLHSPPARSQDLAALWNGMNADGASTILDTTATPTATGGEAISDQPGFAATAGQGTSVEFQPVIWPGRAYKISQLPRANVGFSAIITGTLGAYTVLLDMIRPRPLAEAAQIAARAGLPNANFTVKDHTGKAVDPAKFPSALAPYLPLDISAPGPAPVKKVNA